MKILALADLHSEWVVIDILKHHLKNNKYDFITISGDFITKKPISYVKELLEILKNQKVFAVRGNCDPLELKDILGKLCIEGKNKKIGDYNISGVGGSIIHDDKMLNEKTEEEFEKELSKLKINNNTIFISHSPPFGILDQAFDFTHIGSKSIKKMIEKKQPLLLICGHVHEECDFKKVGKTIVVNLPPANKLKAGIIYINEQINDIKIEFIDL